MEELYLHFMDSGNGGTLVVLNLLVLLGIKLTKVSVCFQMRSKMSQNKQTAPNQENVYMIFLKILVKVSIQNFLPLKKRNKL